MKFSIFLSLLVVVVSGYLVSGESKRESIGFGNAGSGASSSANSFGGFFGSGINNGSNGAAAIKKKLAHLKTLKENKENAKGKKLFSNRGRFSTPRSSPGNKPVTFSELNKAVAEYLYQGDILLTEKQIDALIAKSQNRSKRQVVSDSFYIWSMPIPYIINSNLDAHTQNLIVQGMAFWQENTCVSFTPQTDPNSAGILFYNDSGCFSYIGYAGIPNQEVSIGVGCNHFGIITHEINHALGVYHEQSRYDRDSFITVDFSNIQSASIANFDEYPNTTISDYNVPYDYGSVMHYGEADFAINASAPNIYALEPYNQNTMGQRFYPNFNDILLVNTHYNCLNVCTTAISCQNGGYQNPGNCSQCLCQWGFGGDLCDQRDPGTPVLCGQTVNATCEWQILTGTTGNYQNQLYDLPYECWYHIQSPNGTQIQLQINQAGGYCSFGCFYGDVEFKVANFTNSGYRFCCPEDLPNVTLTSETNLIMIGAQSRYLEQTFNVSYRIPNCTDTTTVKPTTLKPKPPTKKPAKNKCKCCDCYSDNDTYESESYEYESEEDCGRHHRHSCDC